MSLHVAPTLIGRLISRIDKALVEPGCLPPKTHGTALLAISTRAQANPRGPAVKI
jgi:hypothetical protein